MGHGGSVYAAVLDVLCIYKVSVASAESLISHGQ